MGCRLTNYYEDARIDHLADLYLQATQDPRFTQLSPEQHPLAAENIPSPSPQASAPRVQASKTETWFQYIVGLMQEVIHIITALVLGALALWFNYRFFKFVLRTIFVVLRFIVRTNNAFDITGSLLRMAQRFIYNPIIVPGARKLARVAQLIRLEPLANWLLSEICDIVELEPVSTRDICRVGYGAVEWLTSPEPGLILQRIVNRV
ncbi:hypothetical protein P280DRAFT_518597 [Massarina eburnea CBS 473.64]|uniref:Uncharacterized protein n=1 Tax=Massarina eburnea CBS 473.64 TaxID=1395130 RepID=A0A6A6RYK5_9PLEO|nr:hypothetical protein P280DRAFT_518597 [Massarina eburnea CBS 473.64]